MAAEHSSAVKCERLNGCDQPLGNRGTVITDSLKPVDLGSMEEMAWDSNVSSRRRQEFEFLFYYRLLGC